VPKPEFDILGLGTIAVDDSIYVERYPPPDHKARVNGTGRTLGGQVATALAAASRLGARCAYGAVLGDDDLSAAARRGLGAAGIDCRFVQHAAAAPVHSVIIVDENTGSRNVFFDVSAVVPLPASAISETMIRSAKVLLTDQLGPDTVIVAAEYARRSGVPVVMDMEWAGAERMEELMRLADHLLVPLDLAAAYTGLTTLDRILPELHDRCPRTCTAVTCGKDGCYYLLASSQRDQVQHMPAPCVEAVATTGCGDVFHGAYAAALAAGTDIAGCLRFASAAAAVFATRPSGWQHLPAAGEVDSLLSAHHLQEGA
jgi:sugar/nucleoside kinase (ribokinase family)